MTNLLNELNQIEVFEHKHHGEKYTTYNYYTENAMDKAWLTLWNKYGTRIEAMAKGLNKSNKYTILVKWTKK